MECSIFMHNCGKVSPQSPQCNNLCVSIQSTVFYAFHQAIISEKLNENNYFHGYKSKECLFFISNIENRNEHVVVPVSIAGVLNSSCLLSDNEKLRVKLHEIG